MQAAIVSSCGQSENYLIAPCTSN